MSDTATTYTKHTTHTDALDTLGTVISDREGRDAIHLAVNPTLAGEELAPGESVELGKDGAAYGVRRGAGVGIVDPFLPKMINKGSWFWLVVYPRTITSLRHVWQHADFPAAEHLIEPQTMSELWLRRWCGGGRYEYDKPGYDKLIAAAEAYDSGSRESLHIGGEDASGEVPEEVWHHLSVVLGRDIGPKPDYFSCSC